MDPSVLQAMARWPKVPAVYGWLALDRRGNWLLKDPAGDGFGRVGNAALRDFIARNYADDERGCWFFQNGPQRVYVALAYAPLVLHITRARRSSTTAGERRAHAPVSSTRKARR